MEKIEISLRPKRLYQFKNISQHDNYTTLEQKYSRQSLIIHELQSEIEKSKELENKKKKK